MAGRPEAENKMYEHIRRVASGSRPNCLCRFSRLFSTARPAQETLRVGKAGREAFSFVPVDIGDRLGFFKKHNLAVQISSFAGEARLQQAMAADSIDISLASGVGMAFIVKGSPVKAVAAFAGPPLLFALVVHKDAPLQTRQTCRAAR